MEASPETNLQQRLNAALPEVLEFIRSDCPEAFEVYFELLFDRQFPPHARKWIRQLYEAHALGKGYLEEAFRFSWKTTVLTVAFLSYRIGLEPNKTNLIIQVKDENAEGTAAKVRDTIATNPIFRLVFPNVVPDEKRGWANRGYFVKPRDADYGTEEYGEWLRTVGTDPTFVGYGITSSSIIGKHPNGCLIVDDIHDQNNTASTAELNNIVDILKGTVYPTMAPHITWTIFVGTPWVRGDALDYSSQTGFFLVDHTPIYVDKDGERIYTWPELYGPEEVDAFRGLYGPVQFARMCLCDITATQGLELHREWLQEWRHDNLRFSYPIWAGVDWASLKNPNQTNRDNFAMAIGVELPGGGIVLVDGVYERLTTAEAVVRMKAMRDKYPTMRAIGFETLGKGEEVFTTLVQTSNLPLIPQGVGNKSKSYRYGQILAPAFQSNRIFVTDSPNPFVIAFINEWIEFPAGDHDDALDAVFQLAKVALGPLLRDAGMDAEDYARRTAAKKISSPYAHLNRDTNALFGLSPLPKVPKPDLPLQVRETPPEVPIDSKPKTIGQLFFERPANRKPAASSPYRSIGQEKR